MALNKNDLLSLIASNLPDNTVGSITPALLRQVVEQMVTADLNLEELTTQIAKGIISALDDFSVGGEQLEYPGDPSGSAENVINCKCVIGYEIA